MNSKALEELYKILKERDWTEFCPEKNRQLLLDKWVDKWIVEVEQSQFVVNPKYLDSEYSDALKYKLGQGLAEKLSEDCTSYSTENTKITAKLWAIRRKAK